MPSRVVGAESVVNRGDRGASCRDAGIGNGGWLWCRRASRASERDIALPRTMLGFLVVAEVDLKLSLIHI